MNGPYNTFGVGAVIYDEALEGIVKGIQSIKRNGVEEVIIKSYYSGVSPNASAEWVWSSGSPKIIGRHVWMTDYWRNNLGLYGDQANVSMVGHDIEYPLSARVAKQPQWGDVIEVEWLIPDTTQPPGDPIDVPDDPVDPGEDPIAIPIIGIWEAVDDLPGVTDPVLIKKFAQAMLKKYSVPGVEVEFETYRFGLTSGQETTLTLNKYGVYNMTAKVEAITFTEEGMRLLIVAVGQRVPDWAASAYDDYAKRFPPELKVELKAIKTEPRGSKTLQTLYAAERERIEAAIPRGTRVVALDERGTSLTTKALAERLKGWQLGGDDVALVIGGPDGLDPDFRQAAHERIRLSDLTLPHAMVRVLLIEQLYRAWSVNAGHPYHRE
jgi:23S rRNA (pseudouridine1915-N3)-methyltransferase